MEGNHIRRADPVGDRRFALVNLGRLGELFQAHELDVLVCRGGLNVSYLSGIATPGTLGRHLDLADSPREIFVVWPANGDPVAIVDQIASQLARSTGWIDDVRVYSDYTEVPERVLASVLTELRLDSARVGVDMGWCGARRWEELRRLLPRVDFVDITDGMDSVRAIKTEAEVGRLRDAARLLDRVFAEVFPTIRAGQTEREVHASLTSRALELGADSVHGILQSSSNQVLYGGESEVPLEAGDLVRTDYVAYVDRYAANLSRVWCIGRPSDELRRRYSDYVEIYRQAVSLLRPQAAGSTVHESIQRLFTDRGWRAGPPISGHGIGVWFHQQSPLLVPGSIDVLEPGMVVALEPISDHWHLQDEYLITEAEPVRISDAFDFEELPWVA